MSEETGVLEAPTQISAETLKQVLSNPQVNGFVSYEEQYYIYDTLLFLGFNPFNNTVLHYGCGNGEFIRYSYSKLSPQQQQVAKLSGYHGIDIREDIINIASEIYKDIDNAEFTSKNLTDIEDSSYDWCISPHYFIYRDPELTPEKQWESIKDSIKELYRISRQGVLLTLLSNTGEIPDDEAENVNTLDKSNVYTELLDISSNITIIDNYSDMEFSVYIHKIENNE